MAIKIVEKDPINVVGVRVVGPYPQTIPQGFEQLYAWRSRHQVVPGDWLALYWDDPSQVPPQELRADVVFGVAEGFEMPVDQKVLVSEQTIPGGLYAVYYAKIKTDQFTQTWHDFYQELAASEYQPTMGACYERYLNDGSSGEHEIEIYQSVEPK
ncbi:GyrI-like domain-containing protein [Edaphovirga cremea]|uniref:GyrI-like domain-containing protein n=1 Tax=Edaphovirga cremea TaxID=2267246 RepID=UPI000DEFF5F8|nr:GyrI-like domain-containing protein [Edaphovirga cremea]